VGSDQVRFCFIGADERGGDGSRDGDHRPLWKTFMVPVAGRGTGNGEGVAIKGEMTMIKVLNDSY
jgi:hypothetical protein